MPTGPALSFQPSVEALEDRTLMAAHLSAALDRGVLRIDGTAGNDAIVVRTVGNRITVEGAKIQVPRQGQRRSVLAGAVTEIVVNAQGGNDQVTVSGDIPVRATVWAGDGNDVVQGGGGDDLLDGGAGHDQLHGGGGNDTLRGYTGNDRLWGDSGNDRLEGSTGNDELRGGDGNDSLDGHLGANKLYGDSGNDALFAQSTADEIDGGTGRDTVRFRGAATGRGLSSTRGVEATTTTPSAAAAPTPPRNTSTTPTPTPTVSLSAQEQRLVELTNAYRVSKGLRPVTIDAKLTVAARSHAAYMARTGHYNHVRPDGTTLVDRVKAAGYRFSFVAENIHLYDPSNPRTLGIAREYRLNQLAEYYLDGWKVSPSHDVNLLSTYPVHVGVAFARDSEGRIYADIVLGRP